MSLRSIFILGISGFLYFFQSSIGQASGRSSANEPGSASLTRVTHFAFLQNLGNPCGVSSGLRLNGRRHSEDTRSSSEFYHSMLTAILIAIQKEHELENADPVNELYQHIYQSGIFLAAHLRIMGLDRQMMSRRDALDDDHVVEDPDKFSQVMTLRCGNESDSFLTLVRELTTKMEDLLCTLITGSTKEQRASFRIPYNSLLGTPIYRYHSSCSLLQTRDCLLVKETKSALNNMLSKFNKLLIDATDQLQFASEYAEMENNLY